MKWAGGRPDFIAISDNQEESDQLLGELTTKLSGMTQYGTVYIAVQYVGKHKEPLRLTWVNVVADAGMLAAGIVVLFLGGPISIGVSSVILAADAYSVANDIGELLHPGLPGGAEYRQYKVTARWYEEENYSGCSEVILNQYEFYYLRDNRILDDPQWYLQADMLFGARQKTHIRTLQKTHIRTPKYIENAGVLC